MNLVDVDSAGGIKAREDASREFLQARSGAWRLFGATDDLTVLLRDGYSARTHASFPTAVLAGDLSAFSAPDLIAFLAQSRASGVLLVRSSVDRTLSLREGSLCWGTSAAEAERLGEIVLRYGMLPREELERVRHHFDLDPGGRKLGRHIVEAGHMNGHDLWLAVQHQISEILWAVLLAKTGSFVFVRDHLDPSLESQLSLDTNLLLMEGVRRVDEMRHFTRRLPTRDVVPFRSVGASPAGLPPGLSRVLSYVDGRRSLADIGIDARVGEFEATKAVHALLESRLVTVDATPRERTPTPGTFDAIAVAGAYNLAFSEILQAVAEFGIDAPYRISLSSFLAREQKSQPLLKGIDVAADGTLSLAAVTGLLDGASLRGLLESVLAFALFQARDILDTPVGETLTRKVRGIVGPLSPRPLAL